MENRASDFGIDMLEELVVPVNAAADITKCKATVQLNVTGSDIWGPALHNDGKWNVETKQMTEV